MPTEPPPPTPRAAQPDAAASMPPIMDAPRRGGVLIVDDDPWMRRSMTRYLAAEGIDVQSARDPEAAFALWSEDETRFSLVFMDIRFPEGELGFDAARRIKEASREPPVIIGMTSFDTGGRKDEADAAGMQEVMVKPLFKWLVVNLARRHCCAEDPTG